MVKGNIYKITSSKTEKIYIGSTSKNIYTRKEQHDNDYLNYINGQSRKYCSSYQILKYEDAKIFMLEEFENITKKDLIKKEQEYINNEKNSVNIVLNNFGLKKKQDEETKNINKNIVELKEINNKIKLEKRFTKEKKKLEILENKNKKIINKIEIEKEKIKNIEYEKKKWNDINENNIKNILKNITIITNNNKNKIKIKDLYEKIKENINYISLKKEQKRYFTYKKLLCILDNDENYKYLKDYDGDKIYVLKKMSFI